MKLKELPVSIFKTYDLKLRSSNKLKTVNGDEYPVVISLTTISFRLPKVHIVIRNILSQKTRPKHIVLWLNEHLKNDVPNSLKILEGDIFKIKFSPLDCPHLKLVESIKSFSDLPIITCDDDIIYSKLWLSSLIETYKEVPNKVIAHKVRCIKYNESGDLLSYKKWNCSGSESKKSWLPIGSEGVLYPPNLFSSLITNEDLFLKLAPKADDLWFKAVALSENIFVEKVKSPVKEAIPIMGTQKISLKKENVNEDKNVKQWQALQNYFGFNLHD